MTYAIIGTGNVGTALARRFVQAGLPAVIANTRGPDSIAPLITGLGGGLRAATAIEALDADVIFLAIPFTAVEALARSRPNWAGKIVVDLTNAYGVSPQVLAGRLSSEIVAAALEGADVVKAFNQLPAAVLARDPAQDGGRRVVFIAGDSDTANAVIETVATELGFSPIVLGRLDEGGRLLHIPGPLVLHNLIEQPLK